MADKTDQRRSKRTDIKLSLEVSSVFKQDNVWVQDINAPIEVRDISRGGIGFVSESTLPVGYYFNARLELGGKDNVLNAVVQIIRQTQGEDGRSSYGCEFVGRAPVFDYIFDELEKQYS